MLYQEFLPDLSLRSDIECYWSIESKNTNTGFRTVYPDGCMDIIFNFGNALMRKQHNKIELNHEGAFVVGNMLTPIESKPTGYLNLLGVRFSPGGMSSFFRFPLHSFTDLSVPIADMTGEFEKELTEKLYHLSLTGKINYLNDFFKRRRIVRPEVWRKCLHEITLNRKPVSVIAREAGISEKHLQRKFHEHVGIGPKQLSQVLRFRELKERLNDCAAENLMSLAWELGFTDHAHLTKTFKTFAGITPTEYLVS